MSKTEVSRGALDSLPRRAQNLCLTAKLTKQ